MVHMLLNDAKNVNKDSPIAARLTSLKINVTVLHSPLIYKAHFAKYPSIFINYFITFFVKY